MRIRKPEFLSLSLPFRSLPQTSKKCRTWEEGLVPLALALETNSLKVLEEPTKEGLLHDVLSELIFVERSSNRNPKFQALANTVFACLIKPCTRRIVKVELCVRLSLVGQLGSGIDVHESDTVD